MLETMQPLNSEFSHSTDFQPRKVTSDYVISFESNYYSVPFQYEGKYVGVKDLKNDTFEIDYKFVNCITSTSKSD